MATKTNAVRIVEHEGIPCREYFYEYDENDLKGTHAAHAMGMPEEQVFKTLVARGDKTGPIVLVIPCAMELDLKKCAAVSGNKRVELIAVKELLGLTGYIRGGCSPVGMKKKFPTYFEESAQLFDEITVSAGIKGCQLLVKSEEILKVTEAKCVDITA